MTDLFKTLRLVFLAALAIVLVCMLFSCRTLKRNSSVQKTEQRTTEQVEVKKVEQASAAETTSTKEQAQREGYTSWQIQLSADSDAVPVRFTMPDGSVFSGKARAVSGTGRLTEQRATETVHQKTEQHQAQTDSSASREAETKQVSRSVATTRDANSFWRPAAIVAGIIALALIAYLYFKPRIPFLSNFRKNG